MNHFFKIIMLSLLLSCSSNNMEDAALGEAVKTKNKSQQLRKDVKKNTRSISAGRNVTDCNTVPMEFSPNNDSVNDEFIIPFLSKYPDFSIEIFNELGIRAYNYINNGRKKPIWWNGYANTNLIVFGSGPISVGTYYYIIKLNDGSKKGYKGRIYLNR
ncbi:gliding motility-associated C-terminal domain-containing protein [Tenacibaculum sp. C7A-26P2]|uniref:T9SS type B sorting domain-containing protein n=1 Tax=Tenacibaculum sp. C7A-26P2 TaxID=3447504 RepID=UPI003F872FBB